jgi:mono/diheme cytochrome c family protein
MEKSRNKQNMRRICYIIISLAGLSVLISSCDYGRNTTGWQYFDDMAKSPAYETYSPNPNFADGKTMQPPVEGTIPREMIPYPYQKTDEDRLMAAKTLVNPVEVTAETLERGKRMYEVYCMICHGPQGDGKGSLYTSGKYTYPPASLLSDKMMGASDGDFYHVITAGHGIMAEHGSMIRPDDRWKITHYVKNVLQSQAE